MTGEAEKLFIETYEREREELPGAGLGWLDARRDEAAKAFAASGLPHRRMEDWRYTDLRRALTTATLTRAPRAGGAGASPDASARPAIAAIQDIDRHVIVFANGRLSSDLSSLSLPAGVTLLPFARALAEPWSQSLVEMKVEAQAGTVIALNTALMQDGIGLHLARGAKLDKPLHLVFLANDEGAFHLRHFIRLEEGAEAVIFETHVDDGARNYFADHVTDVSLAKDASLTRIKTQDESTGSVHLASLTAELGAGAKLSGFTMTLGAATSRDQTFVTFRGEGAEAHISGATALRGRQHGDHFVAIDHAVPHCASATLYKTVLDGEATGVFQGKVVVRPGAQKTDGKQMTNALLLSRDAAMNAKPELEIYADDVQCAHGSTIGELDAQALFYLRSRGIDEPTARQLLISAFLDEVFERISHETAREALRALASGWFQSQRSEKP